MDHSDLTYFIGLDLGRGRNHTALVVLERSWRQATREEVMRSNAAPGFTGEYRYRVVGADRVSLGTPYPQIIKWVKSKIEAYKLLATIAGLIVDATGVGSAVMDYLRAANLSIRIIGTVITGTQAAPVGIAGLTPTGYQTVSRNELLTSLQLAVQDKRFTISRKDCRESEALCRELSLLRMEGKSPGSQDDLAFALALTVWWGMRKFARQPDS